MSVEQSASFSLSRLERENPGLASYFIWDNNPMPMTDGSAWLHMGCGVRVFDGFVNLDICPQDLRVVKWNFLGMWPEQLAEKIEGVFSEDCFEHFFHGEQTYILCNINRALRPGGVARILMPLLAMGNSDPGPGDYFHDAYGVETNTDALNYGMRFTGHRWLHNQNSLARMASICGLEATPTNCSTSIEPKFNGLNLRDETNSASFAADLRKTRSISRRLVSSGNVTGATKIEDVANGSLYVATTARPTVEYSLQQSVPSESVVCINFRSSNLSSFDWPLKTLVIDEVNRGKPWYFDETLKSQPCMNVITKSQLKVALGGHRNISTLHFSPATNPGEFFTVGCAELYRTK